MPIPPKTQSHPDRSTYTLRETCIRLGVSYGAAVRQVRENRFPLPTMRVGTRIVVPRAPLDQFLSGTTPDAA